MQGLGFRRGLNDQSIVGSPMTLLMAVGLHTVQNCLGNLRVFWVARFCCHKRCAI